jgi:Cu/Ag efflux pump CusA
VTGVRDLLIHTSNGRHVRLADVAKVSVASTPNVIEREGVSRHVDIRADIAGRDIASVAADVKERLQKVQFPLEYHAALLRDYADGQVARWRSLIASFAAAAGIYLLLQACFQSWRLAGLFCLTLLAALSGGLLGMFAAGGTVFLGSLAGCIAVVGLAARHGILLIKHFQNLESQEGEAYGPGLILRGARERFMPLAASVIAIAVALLPLVLAGNIAGLEIVHPMAVVVLGGLITTVIANLFVVPALYLSVARPQPETRPYGSEQHAT